ncbi:hypothetical protein [Haliangium sp.]
MRSQPTRPKRKRLTLNLATLRALSSRDEAVPSGARSQESCPPTAFDDLD